MAFPELRGGGYKREAGWLGAEHRPARALKIQTGFNYRAAR